MEFKYVRVKYREEGDIASSQGYMPSRMGDMGH